MIDTLAIIGVGLLGGSVALAVREHGIAKRIIGVSRNQHTLNYACSSGMIDSGITAFDKSLNNAELAVICTPVDSVAPLALELLENYLQLRVTDVGSTKLTILEAINLRSELASRFIGGHPLAGSEKSGPEHAQKDLFRNKMVFLSPSITTSSTTLQLVTTFWKSLQAITIEISPEKHDTVMAFTSHLPHLISFTLAGVIPQDYIEYSGTGLRSMCRLAGGDPSMWSAIVKENREPILNCLDLFQGNLNTLRRAIEKNNPSLLSNLFDAGRRTYHALGS